MVDPSGLAPEEEGGCECCCCVDSVVIESRKLVLEDPMFGIQQWGHRITHTASFLHMTGSSGKCKLEWYECSSTQTPEMREKEIVANAWFDAHATFGDISETTNEWNKYENNQPPFDKMPCPGSFAIKSVDTPVIASGGIRVLKFAIRVTSAPDCNCTYSSWTSYRTQILITKLDGTRDPWIIAGGMQNTQEDQCGPPPV